MVGKTPTATHSVPLGLPAGRPASAPLGQEKGQLAFGWTSMERGEECSHLGLLQRTQEDGTTQSLGEMAEQLRDRCEGGLSQQVHSPLRNPQGKPLCLLSNSGGHHSFLQYYHDVSAVVWESYLYLDLEHSAHPKRELVSQNCQASHDSAPPLFHD